MDIPKLKDHKAAHMNFMESWFTKVRVGSLVTTTATAEGLNQTTHGIGVMMRL